jgi:SAM-dependent methyltransferase
MKDYVALNSAQIVSESDPFTAARYRQFSDFLSMDQLTVLDVGCNTGRGGISLKSVRPQASLVGLDLLQARLDRLPAGVYSRTICGSATEIPLEAESVDAIVAGEFIEHLPAPAVMAFFHESFRVLRMRGKLLLTTPNPLDLKRRLRGRSILGGSHVSQHFPAVVKLQMQMAGFSAVKVRGSGKVSSVLGTRFPALFVYGSYLAAGEKF